MSDAIASIETLFVSIPNPEPYLAGAFLNPEMERRGYLVSPVNNTIYPSDFRSVLVKVTTRDGCVGWGETYGLCAPKTVAEIHRDIMAPYLVGRDPLEVEELWDEVYDLMRVRGYRGFYGDALAALDIALWDITGKLKGQSLTDLLGGARRDAIPAYVSGIKGGILKEGIDTARGWVEAGFRTLKLHAIHTNDLLGDVRELREALGPDVEIAVDLHWRHTSDEAEALLAELAASDVLFAEAPVKPEDLEGLVALAQRTSVPLAVGEEWRTVHDAVSPLARNALDLLQPEMGHVGITQFARIAALGEAHGVKLAPHSTIGSGIFLTASLHASAAIPNLRFHEFHPAIVARCADLLSSPIRCENGSYALPAGSGLGCEPSAELLAHAQPI